ncbi:MAG: DUF2341 domain-containing protein [Methylicorpusculum sp.]|uniref:DUF2341 domain-containing protein n=1 Tax=Methylicorpusculum sp. TaxID=2713644 RepID=UPI002717D37F|nr:DUF2341 domain-containing protein [Methylicorpusculum sp.]MDO8846021.1 DUF2341 domain-containing protein [Methylicorpusculum sp.]MDO8938490.1 DUF2341 domain-containing protein [Methylicorpusculum sp.]MDO9238544.1 DUF2341 domain-containing protein [Methylicorpusculum sp.]MDP2202041.1 DUF2341 domain-containing protein [Methylicorpusculum sp.]
MKRFAFFLILLAFVPTIASAWWNEDWAYKKKINLDTNTLTQSGVTIPDDSYALIRLHTGNFGNFLDLAENGKDIRVLSADEKTPLKFFIEKLDPFNEMAFIWVKLPKDMAGMPEPAIWIYSGNPEAVDGQDAPGSFDVTQMLTYTFSKEGIKDLSANNHHPSEATATIAEGGLIGEGAVFQGSQVIRIPASPSLQMRPEQGWTFSAWLKIDQAQVVDSVVFQIAGAKQNLTLSVRDSMPFIEVVDSTGVKQGFAGLAPLEAGAWHHLALVASAGNIALYIDGKSTGSYPVSLTEFSDDVTIGADAQGGRGYVGMMDHIVLYKTARDANALSFDTLMQGPNSTLLTYGEDASGDSDGGGESRIMATLRDVTTDGWVIIGLLGIMFVMSWIIMIVKSIVLNKNYKENRNFEDEFTKLKASDISNLNRETTEDDEDIEESPILLSMTGGHARFAGSSIYILYHVGVEEMNRRLAKAVGADVSEPMISDKGINSVRAAMESALVREIQKLNNQMVILTIAISGGPFLGLLGTVLGVMITFGDIAASGEVNVNAIAPGIAAALATTVAGLLVAIPALFGYNYLASRIKLITADMYIFVDEFTTKLSEQYS